MRRYGYDADNAHLRRFTSSLQVTSGLSAWRACPPTRRMPSSSVTRLARPGARGSSRRRSLHGRWRPTGPAWPRSWTTCGPGDTLVVWKLDRLGRSVKEVLTIADDLHERGIGVKILTGKLSGTYTPTGEGKFFFTMMAAFAELERDMTTADHGGPGRGEGSGAHRGTADRDGR